MSISADKSDHELISQTIIDTNSDSAGVKSVAFYLAFIVDVHKVAKTRHPDTPPVFRSRLQRIGHNLFDPFSCGGCFVSNQLLTSRGRPGIPDIGCQSRGSAYEIVETVFNIKSL